MRIWSILGALVIAALPFTSVWAENMTPEEIKKLVDEAVKQRMEEYERREGAIKQKEGAAAPTAEPGIGPLPEVSKDLRTETQPALSFGSSGSGRLVYAKPFVSAPKAIVGGYIDMQFRSQSKASIEAGDGRPGVTNNFDQQRFVPFIYADITEHVKVATEIEIEHGVRESSGNEIEVSLEFGFIDYLVNEPFNLRAGILLMPLGKFNLLHDSPLNDLTDRPLVSQLIIPSTMSETGAGFYGTVYPGRTSKIDYELYVTTGPCGYAANGTPLVNEANGTSQGRQRDCAGHDGADINNGKAVVGRLAYSPMLGMEVGGSSYYGNANNNGSNYVPLSITALDWTLQRGPFEVIGEAAWAYARGNSRAVTGNTIPGPPPAGPGPFSPGQLLTGIGGNSGMATPPQRMSGFYIQGNYHFMPEFLSKFSPKRFGPGSTFTAVIRYDRVNTDLDNTNNTGGFGNLEQLSFGLNYRPIEDTAIKLSYQYQPMAYNPNTLERIHDRALVMSIATYF
jgi:Phosphate-selective porin O and P